MIKKRKHLYIECGTTLNTELVTGIQRVVRNILNEIDDAARSVGYKPILIEFSGLHFRPLLKVDRTGLVVRIYHQIARWLHPLNKYLTIKKIKKQVKTLLKSILIRLFEPHVLHIRPIGPDGLPSVLLLIDSTWNVEMLPSIARFRANGGLVCAVLYDLIPFSHSSTVDENTRLLFVDWWRKSSGSIDCLMCISQSVRQEYIVWQRHAQLSSPLAEEKIGFFHLGSDIGFSNDPVIRVVSQRNPFFLVVSSLEPRKNHKTVLDAFELLWMADSPVWLVLVWRAQWKSETLLKRLETHQWRGKKLFFINDASDRDLAALYRSASGLIMASTAEGYGLPIVEAGRIGLQVFCSDIPVFREIGGDFPIYFPPLDSRYLAECVNEQLLQSGSDDQRKIMKTKSWKESAEELVMKIDGITEGT